MTATAESSIWTLPGARGRCEFPENDDTVRTAICGRSLSRGASGSRHQRAAYEKSC